MKPTNQIGFLLQHLAFSLARQSDHVLQENLGIGYSQFKIMMVLQKYPHVRQNVIADRLGQTEASISRQIKLMYDDGLLQSVPRAEDRRENITTLTARGERITEEATSVLNKYYAPMFKTLPSDKQKQLIGSLTQLHDDICQTEQCGTLISNNT